MPEALSTLGAILTVFSVAQYVQQENIDVYVNGQQVAQQEQTQRKEKTRGEQILENAIARREQILLANQQVVSQTNLR